MNDAAEVRNLKMRMVILDECHHAGAAIAEDVLNAVSAKYVYGLTATPKSAAPWWKVMCAMRKFWPM